MKRHEEEKRRPYRLSPENVGHGSGGGTYHGNCNWLGLSWPGRTKAARCGLQKIREARNGDCTKKGVGFG